jgi:hypothetical protein
MSGLPWCRTGMLRCKRRVQMEAGQAASGEPRGCGCLRDLSTVAATCRSSAAGVPRTPPLAPALMRQSHRAPGSGSEFSGCSTMRATYSPTCNVKTDRSGATDSRRVPGGGSTSGTGIVFASCTPRSAQCCARSQLLQPLDPAVFNQGPSALRSAQR